MSTVSRQIRAFLDGHKDEVLVIVIEDYVPPERIREVLQGAGLTPFLLDARAGKPLPTLGAMVRGGKRLVVSIENGHGGPTLPNAFAGPVEETPFTFLRPSELGDARSCRPNRGLEGAPIFQFNHWLTPAARQSARLVSSTVLRDRVRQCTQLRVYPRRWLPLTSPRAAMWSRSSTSSTSGRNRNDVDAQSDGKMPSRASSDGAK